MEKLVSLHDHRVASAALLPAAGATRCREAEHFAPDHRLSDGGWGELGHLFANEAHLLAVGIIGGEATHFVAER
jgi:hypothetical protein